MTNINDARNLTLLMDFYELTMAAGYFEEGYTDKVGVFDMFFRKIPDGGGFAIAAGLEQFCEVVDNLHFSEEDIEYLRGKGCFSEQFLDYLRRFEFHCNIWAVAEGTPIFPHEPIVIVEGPAIEAQLIETLLLVTFNHQSLIATKTNRIVRAAQGRPVMEFGSRRAQGYDAAVLGARAAYIGGVVGTACVMADRQFGIPALGTMAHSWVQMFPSEYEAFKRYAERLPRQLHAAGGYLQRGEERCAQCHPRVRRSTQASGHPSQGRTHRFQGTLRTFPKRRAKCWMRRAIRTAACARPTLWTNIWCGT